MKDVDKWRIDFNARSLLWEVENANESILIRENIELRAKLETAIRFLKEGKALFRPNTTNSFVDDFIAGYEAGIKPEVKNE